MEEGSGSEVIHEGPTEKHQNLRVDKRVHLNTNRALIKNYRGNQRGGSRDPNLTHVP